MKDVKLTVYNKGVELGFCMIPDMSGSGLRLDTADVYFEEYDSYKLDDRIMVKIKNRKEVSFKHLK